MSDQTTREDAQAIVDKISDHLDKTGQCAAILVTFDQSFQMDVIEVSPIGSLHEMLTGFVSKEIIPAIMGRAPDNLKDPVVQTIKEAQENEGETKQAEGSPVVVEVISGVETPKAKA